MKAGVPIEAGLRSPAWWAAAREGASLMGGAALGSFAWGVATGLALVKVGLSPWQALGMIVLVFSGTAQLAALPLIAQGAALPAIWLTATLANLRFVVYSALLAGEFRHRSLAVRLLMGWLTTDSGLAAYLADRARGRRTDSGLHSEPSEAERAARFIGVNTWIYLCWTSGSVLGVLLAGFIPDSPRVAFVGVLAVVALLGPMITTRTALAVAIVAGGVAAVGASWPARLGVFAATAAGIAVAMAFSRERAT
jgi:predicted branched-subunit amino acid permease